ncbi:MAG: selenocysteine-specific translation elongation factor [Planctomycetota bacterium]|jgi:selenocysteine-specific elongation factor
METTPITVGTAGHIDHGKTQLVERLTGMRADRPYERERGMTIDIGYAEMRAPDGRRIGFVDLPGHERFIRNMVAGATGIDLALLVVAADDGVMPQTREHTEILELIGVRRALVVLNKIDLVDEETRELALEELREFLAPTALRAAPVVACSAATGEGVEEVGAQLLALVGEAAADEDPGAFFVGVQRTFAATGFGCIVTGVPAAGHVAVGDEVEVLPAGKRARVRAIEIYHEPAPRARAGHRTALNLAGISHDEVARGMVVAAPGVYEPGRHVAVKLRLLGTARRPLKHAGGARFLTGTLETMASVYLLSGDALAPGASALVEVRTANPVAARAGAPFILRSDNAKETLGGGRIVAVRAAPLGRRDRTLHARLESWAGALDRPAECLRLALRLDGPAAPTALAVRCQLAKEATAHLLAGLCAEREVEVLPGGAYVLTAEAAEAAEAVRATLAAMHREHPLLGALPVAEVRDRAGISEPLLLAAIARLGDDVVAEGRLLRLASHRVSLAPELTRAADRVLACLDEARFAPPARDKLAGATGLDAPSLTGALTFLGDRGAVREVAPGMLYSKAVLDEGIRLLQAVARERGSFEPVDAKAVLGGISRKWLIPLLEYYDRLGATRRDGNARMLTRRGEAMAEGGIDGGG